MRQNSQVGNCGDYYCDANSVCGVACAEVDLMEANMHSFHSTLHGKTDPYGAAAGFGGGGLPASPGDDTGWNGPRDFTKEQFKPGSNTTCIDTSRPFSVTASFPLDENGVLLHLEMRLTQSKSGGDDDAGSSSSSSSPPSPSSSNCELNFNVGEGYAYLEEVTLALEAGMTPIVSYWSSGDMGWMDGQGVDGLGGCPPYTTPDCSLTGGGKISNLRISSLDTSTPSPTPANMTAQDDDVDDDGPSSSQAESHTLSAGAVAGLAFACLMCACGVGLSFGYQLYLRYGYGSRCFNPLMDWLGEFEAWRKTGFQPRPENDFKDNNPDRGSKGSRPSQSRSSASRGSAAQENEEEEEEGESRRARQQPVRRSREQRQRERALNNNNSKKPRSSRDGGGSRRSGGGGGGGSGSNSNVAPREWMDKRPRVGPPAPLSSRGGVAETEMGPQASFQGNDVGYV
jgi:hypothetical protein